MPADISLRASDADRESVAARLAEQFAVGRLDLAEYDERVAAAYAATTVDELTQLLRDLPTQPATPPGQSVSAYRCVRPVWTNWAVTTVICLTIWAATSIVAQDIVGFWPFWVFGPWGVVLLVRTLNPLRRAGATRGWTTRV